MAGSSSKELCRNGTGVLKHVNIRHKQLSSGVNYTVNTVMTVV